MSATAATAHAPPASATPAEDAVSSRTWIAVIVAILGVFMAVLDTQITNASLREILGSLSATRDEGSWITTAYLSAEVIVIPLTGLFIRVFGERAYMFGNTLAFLLFSTLCGLAWDLPSMIVFRAIQGFTGGALIPTAMTLVLTHLPPKKRPIGLAWLMLASTLAPTLGPTVGGILTNAYGWPSIFFINWLPGVLMLAGIAYGLPRVPKKLGLLLDADWLAISTMVIGLGSLIVFLEEGNRKDWFASDFIQCAFLLAVIGLVSCLAILLTHGKPFVNIRLFAQRNFFVSSAVGAVAGMGLYGSTFVLPLFLAHIAGYNSLQIGSVILWMGWPQIIMMPIAAVLSKRFDNRIICSFGLLLFAVSCFMNSNMDAGSAHDQFIYSQIFRSLGQPFIILTLSNFAIHRMALADMPSASSLYNMSRILGGAIGTAILATTITVREQFHSAQIGMSVSLFSDATRERIDQMAGAFLAPGGDWVTASHQAVAAIDNIVRRDAFVMAYNDCFFILGVVLSAAIAVIWIADRVVAAGK